MGTPMPDEYADPAREAALALLRAVTQGRRTLAEVTERTLAPLAPADRAAAQRLATGTLRWADRADRALGPLLRARPAPAVHDVLRMALYETMVEGVAPHGAVNAAVSLVRAMPHGDGPARMANAVLRKVVAAGAGAWAALPPPQMPKWLRKPLIADYGKPAVTAMEAAHAAGAPLDLTPRDGDAGALAARLGGMALPGGSVRLRDAGRISALPGYDAGEWWVQDAAAAMPARVLAAAPGEAVLDMCAAPGGKTLQLAAAGAEVTALDISAARLARVADNLARCRLTARIVTGDALTLAAVDDARYDAVLLDAPCSATGTLRRHPDLPYARDGSGFPAIFALQAAMIDAALRLVRPGGRVVCCTCSLLIDEGEEQVRDALARHPDLAVDRAALDLPGIDPDWIGPEGGVRLRPDYWPERGGMDGFYIVAFHAAGQAGGRGAGAYSFVGDR
jgi:16S rRNA (cytosine967-C5)-methyltransferase